MAHLCKLMVMDFNDKIGRWDIEAPDERDRLRYSDNNLRDGITYAEDMIEMGYSANPLWPFHLRNFIKWANWRLSL